MDVGEGDSEVLRCCRLIDQWMECNEGKEMEDWWRAPRDWLRLRDDQARSWSSQVMARTSLWLLLFQARGYSG